MTVSPAQFSARNMVALLWLCALAFPTVVVGFSPSIQTAPRSATALKGIMKPTKEQQEQLDKYGQNPETNLEMIFDSLADENNPMTKMFLHFQPEDKKKKWKEFLGGYREHKSINKQKKQEMRERGQRRLEEKAAAKAAAMAKAQAAKDSSTAEEDVSA